MDTKLQNSYWIAIEGHNKITKVWQSQSDKSDEFVITIFVRQADDDIKAPVIIRGTTEKDKREITVSINGEEACAYEVKL